MTKVVWGARVRLAGVLLLLIASTSCGQLTRQGTSSSYLIIMGMEAASGAEDTEFRSFLLSDVVTVVDGASGIYNDPGRVTFSLALKDAGSAAAPSTPTQANWITVERYHVKFVRADGRDKQGEDVPYEFDGAMGVTVSGGEVEGGFNLVRHTAKMEAPLGALARSSVIISTLAEVTFYGHDQTGRAVSAVGHIQVEFGNFADPS
jgi:hypothetical protein